ncbi:TPA_asm: P3 [Fraxinus gammacytorhabdovirus 1]|nr:TPA_asm: P3 [Fraxinus gammacytorhabdovirus 1]
MFITNLSTQVKSTLKIKRTKISSYGQAGEIKANGWKTKLYMIDPPKRFPYVEISNIAVLWTPTVPHLLCNCAIMVRIRDSRGSSHSVANNELLLLKKSADTAWSLDLPCSIAVPISELSGGLPLLVDIDIPTSSIKSGHEIGKIILTANLLSAKSVEAVKVGPPIFKYQKDNVNSEDIISWKGMPKLEEATNKYDATGAVSKFMDGNISLTELGYLLSKKLSIT